MRSKATSTGCACRVHGASGFWDLTILQRPTSERDCPTSSATTPASTGWRALPRSPLPRKLRKPHEELVYRARALPPFADGPHHERLAAAHVPRGEHFRHGRGVSAGAVGGRLGIAARVLLDAELVQHR